MAEYSRRHIDYPKPFTAYAAADCTITGTNWDVKSNSSLFDTINVGRHIYIETNDDVIVRFNSMANDAVTMSGGDTLTLDNFNVQNVYVTTLAGSAFVKFFMFGWD